MRFNKVRYNYWSCSEFASRLIKRFSGVQRPYAETSEGWAEFHKNVKAQAPITHFLVDEVFDRVQDFVYFPYDVYNTVRVYLENRFVTETHRLKSNLEPGEWHELDSRLEECIFYEFCEFVELDMEHIKYSANYVIDDKDPYNGPNEHQVERSKEILAIYNWIVDVRKNRGDPYKLSGLPEFYATIDNDEHTWMFDRLTPEQQDRNKELHDKMTEIEEQQREDDTEYLTRIIKIRKSLWN